MQTNLHVSISRPWDTAHDDMRGNPSVQPMNRKTHSLPPQRKAFFFFLVSFLSKSPPHLLDGLSLLPIIEPHSRRCQRQMLLLTATARERCWLRC